MKSLKGKNLGFDNDFYMKIPKNETDFLWIFQMGNYEIFNLSKGIVEIPRPFFKHYYPSVIQAVAMQNFILRSVLNFET